MHTVKRPRRYIASHWFALLAPAFRYSRSRDAFVLRGIGGSAGPVLRVDRRRFHQRPFTGVERRHSGIEHQRARVA